MFFGDGPLTLGNGERNPVARGLLISGATVGLVRDGTGKYAVDATGTVSLIGFPDVTVGGTVRVRYNDIGSVHQTIAVGSATLSVDFDTTTTGDVAPPV